MSDLLVEDLVLLSLSRVQRSGYSERAVQEGFLWEKDGPDASSSPSSLSLSRPCLLPDPNDHPLSANLLPNIDYLTSFPLAGLSNQIISHFNLLYLVSNIHASPSPSEMTPILSPFTPHLGHLFAGSADLPAAPVLRFSQVFDIDRLAHELGFGIVEWGELKEGASGRVGEEVWEDEWLDEEERRRVRGERGRREDWPAMVEGRGGEPTDRIGW